jgi:hypothetical protein
MESDTPLLYALRFARQADFPGCPQIKIQVVFLSIIQPALRILCGHTQFIYMERGLKRMRMAS